VDRRNFIKAFALAGAAAAIIAFVLLSSNSGNEAPIARQTHESPSDSTPANHLEKVEVPAKTRNARIDEKAKEALSFCKANECDTEFCVLIDMKIHSGKYRMFIYDFKNQEVEKKALVTHGAGRGDRVSTDAVPLFGNEKGSWLTSLGKYKTGERDYSQWGINVHYKLHGLETSNSNAFERLVVLHSYTPVPSYEIYPFYLPMYWSQGCPVTDDETMAWLDAKLENTKQPVLLWIFY
jgi:hypothetical protein